MEIYGVAGYKESGKSTLANTIAEVAQAQGKTAESLETRNEVTAVANAWRRQFNLDLNDDPVILANRWIADSLVAAVATQTHFEITPTMLEQLQIADNPDGRSRNEQLLKYLKRTQSDPQFMLVPIDGDIKDEHRPILSWLGSRLIEVVHPHIWIASVVNKIKGMEAVDTVTVAGLRYPHDAQQLQALGALIIRTYRPGNQLTRDPVELSIDKIKPDVIVQCDGELGDLRQVAFQVIKNYIAWRGSNPPVALSARTLAAAAASER
ncbi:hypothetical protein HY346_00825 [Candidatus Microgenomates bacterium]|nr:hypothetical protein [Candidatus Microgenomates bacterium]